MQSSARRPPTSRLLVRLIFLSVVVSALVAISAPAASAARPCWKDLVDDYWADNRVDKVYPISCYRDAMEALPSDVKQYSDAQDDLRRALLFAIRDARDSGGTPPTARTGDGPLPPAVDDQGSRGIIPEVLDKLGPKNATSIPVPLLVLASIALLLVGAAGVSYGTRWYQARRLPVAPPGPRP